MQTELERQIAAVGLTAGERLLVAVSGGVDSVVLLQLLAGAAQRQGFSLQVAHLDHQLRRESAADAAFVRQLCNRLDLPCSIETCDVAALAARQKLSLEMAGRQARREFLLRTAERFDVRLIALAHHRGDQVETLLLRLLRGSGVRGLAAMRPLQGRWWRPLLGCSREQILAYAEWQRLEWREDASNSDPTFLRNRLRHQLLPQFRQLNPLIDDRLAELCRQLQEDEDYWQQQLADLFPRVQLEAADGVRLDRQQLLELPAALRLRLLQEGLRRVRGDLQRIEAVHLRAAIELLRGQRSQAALDLPGCWVARRYQQLWLRAERPELLPAYELPLPLSGELALPCGRRLRAQLVEEPAGENVLRVEFDWQALNGELRVRNWRPGDRFRPQGMAGSKKLKQLFADRKVELEERPRVPLLLAGETILWVAGMRRSGHAEVTAKTRQILRLELLESG